MQFTLSQIAQICSGKLYGADSSVDSFVTDSRSTLPAGNALFVAMRGVNHDAHMFVGDMVERGVSAYIVEREVELPDGCGAVVVDNALKALQQLAAFRRQHFDGHVVAIAGSNGKTTVKEWIAQSVGQSVRLYRSPRSYNSQLGVALSLLMMPDDAQIALIEAGISQVGEMAGLEQMIAPQTVIFTNIGDAHQSNFCSLEQKINEKIYLAKSAKRIIYNSEYKQLAAAIEDKYFGCELIDCAMENVGNLPDGIWSGNARIVSAFCRTFGFDAPDFSQLQPLAMRLEVKQGVRDAVIVDDSYSCDIDSLTIALDYLNSVAQSRRKVVILSDILQSEMSEAELYELVAQKIDKSGVELFVGVGEKISTYASVFSVPTRFYGSTEELLADIDNVDIASSAVLIKGNRLSRTERISHAFELQSHTTVLEVNLRAVERNINYFRSKMSPTTKLVAMVKASSYGAGDTEVAQMLVKQGVSYLAVAFADEGAELRAGGITAPIVVLNADDNSFDTMVASHLEPEIYSLRSLDAFAFAARAEQGYPVHIKLDTGMHRLGFCEADIEALLERLDRYSSTLRVASIFTHLCVADDPSQDEFTRGQIALYDRLSRRIADHVGYPVLRHAAASAAIVRFPEAHFDMCRLGLGMYGYGYEHNESLEPASTLRTRIVQVRTVEAGQTVGYGRAGVLERQRCIATIPVGYADGLDRHLGCGRWSMIVGGQSAPTVGRICMDSCMIDVTDIPDVKEGDSVTIFSAHSGNSAEDMAAVLDTIPYEILTSVSKRVKRIYIYE
ncbi:MAG: alanine racemase [Alistipes sp.]|nr:alanine racemase [Alistipes sp.]